MPLHFDCLVPINEPIKVRLALLLPKLLVQQFRMVHEKVEGRVVEDCSTPPVTLAAGDIITTDVDMLD